MTEKTTIEELKKPLIEFIKKNLPVSYITMDEDAHWGVEIDKNGKIKFTEYNGNTRETRDFQEISLSDLANLVESKFNNINY